MPNLEHRLAIAKDIAHRAGELGLRYFRDIASLDIEIKGHQDLVSNADREVELFIRAELAAAFPNDGIVGEEHAPVAGSSGYVWVIDPIDGTANFVRGIPAWCVVIAGTTEGVCDVGVVHEASTGETFSARLGEGAFLNGRPIRVASATSLHEGSIGVGFSNPTDAHRIVPLIDRILAEGGVFYRNASGALMLSYVACGRLLGYVEEHMNAWDCLAAMLIIEESGGVVLRPDWSSALTHGTKVLCGAPGIYPTLEAIAADCWSQ